MVLSYDYSNRNRRRRRTNAPPSWAISMAMAVRRCHTERITRCSMTRASSEATGCRHWATTCSVLPRRLPGRQQTKQRYNMYLTLLAILMAVVAMRWYYTAHITRWRRFVAFIKTTKCHHWASTRSDIIKGTRQRRLFWLFYREKGLQLTCWRPLITIGV